ncbi:MAG: Rieske (2Fe-2S) protein [Candidatus Kapabacteria bacterium]|jgi:Rieske Fe-S protein|nr:Rieske (2Fe-2S) protein [Candidatus Kapabacteria bacterium]
MTASSSERRDFLRKAAASVGIALCAGTAASILSSCEQDESLPGPSATPVSLPLAGLPALATAGSIVVTTVEGVNGNRPVAIARLDATQFAVFSTICGHQGCPVNPPESASIADPLTCPCHGAQYDSRTGKITRQPQGGGRSTDMPTFAARFDEQSNTLVITP